LSFSYHSLQISLPYSTPLVKQIVVETPVVKMMLHHAQQRKNLESCSSTESTDTPTGAASPGSGKPLVSWHRSPYLWECNKQQILRKETVILPILRRSHAASGRRSSSTFLEHEKQQRGSKAHLAYMGVRRDFSKGGQRRHFSYPV